MPVALEAAASTVAEWAAWPVAAFMAEECREEWVVMVVACPAVWEPVVLVAVVLVAPKASAVGVRLGWAATAVACPAWLRDSVAADRAVVVLVDRAQVVSMGQVPATLTVQVSVADPLLVGTYHAAVLLRAGCPMGSPVVGRVVLLVQLDSVAALRRTLRG
jgi:hypothetical protein